MNGQHSDKEQHRRRMDLTFSLLLMLGIVALTLLALWVQSLSHELKVSNDARDALAQQVEELGAEPVAGPPGSRGEPGKTVIGPQGEPGPSGPPGSPGPSGPPGKDGRNGAAGTDGISVTGSPGAPGMQGPPGPPGPPGADGKDGVDGQDGKDGVDGKDGQACPDGYSMQAPAYDPYALVCRMNGAPPPEDESPQPKAAALDPQRRVYA